MCIPYMFIHIAKSLMSSSTYLYTGQIITTATYTVLYNQGCGTVGAREYVSAKNAGKDISEL